MSQCMSQCHMSHAVTTLRSLLEGQSILSEQGSIFLENQLSEQAELSQQGVYFLKIVERAGPKFDKCFSP